MQKGNFKKMIILNAVIVLVNVILFSNTIIKFDFLGGNILLTAFGITVILMSVIVFIYGNYALLHHKEILIRQEDIKNLDDCVASISQVKGKPVFAKSLETILGQIKRFQKKKTTIKDILLQKFSDTEMSYASFQGTIMELEEVMRLNIKSILNRISAFDDEDYDLIIKQNAFPGNRPQSMQSKLEIYNEYIEFVDHGLEDNEQIILRLDKLLLEISKFNSIEVGEIGNMNAIREIDELIKNAKWYK